MVNPLIADSLSLKRGDRQILTSVSATAEPGCVTLITGRSGSGKSSLLSLLSGLEAPDSGLVSRGDKHGKDITIDVGFVLQGYGLVSLLTAAENIEIGLYARGWEKDAAADRATELLRRLGLDSVRDHLVEKMSGGQQQRVAIARALAPEPAVVLADEPTAELDVATRRLVVSELVAAAGRGAVVVIATHDKELREWADREVSLHDGAVLEP